jgi:hypothetical protein
MKPILTAALVILTASAACAAPGDPLMFAKTFADFRYSLYPAIEAAGPEKMQEMSFSSGDRLIMEAKAFLAANKREITAYRNAVLEKCRGQAPELKNYTGKKGFERIPAVDEMIPEGKETEALLTILALSRVDPMQAVSTLITITIGKTETAQELGEFSIRNTLASPRIRAVKKTNGTWTVFADYYDRIFVLELNAETGSCSMEQWYVRKV